LTITNNISFIQFEFAGYYIGLALILRLLSVFGQTQLRNYRK